MKQTILITGVSRGIGHALAQQLLNEGQRLIGTSRTGKIPSLQHKNFTPLAMDLSDHKSFSKTVAYLLDQKIKIDLLINNAGIGPDLNFANPEEQSFRNTFEVNSTGTVFFTEALLPHLNKGGKIINISSKMGAIGSCQKTNATAYRMSKAALNMYSKILANRLGDTLKVAAVHPGWVQTTISNTNDNAPLTPKQAAEEIRNFIATDFKNGIFWNVETQSEIEW